MTRERELSGRAVFWDGEPITLNDAAVIAYPYAQALQLMYPDETITDICVWQVRRGNLHVVPVAEALAHAGARPTPCSRDSSQYRGVRGREPSGTPAPRPGSRGDP